MPIQLRILSFASLLGLTLLSAGFASAAILPPQTITLSAPMLTADAGDTVTVTVDITQIVFVESLSAIKLAVAYDPAVLTGLGATPAEQLAGLPPDGFDVRLDPGYVGVSAVSPDPLPIATGALLHFRFAVKNTALAGAVTPLSLVGTVEDGEIVLLETLDQPLPGVKADPVDGSLTVLQGISCLRGDANPDGAINSADAIVVLRIVVGLLLEPSPEQACGADADRDGEITTGDAIWILREIVGLPHEKALPVARATARLEQAEGTVRLVVDGAAGLYGVEGTLRYDPRALGLSPLAPPSVGLRLVHEPIPGESRLAWAAAEPLVDGERLTIDLPAELRAAGAELRLASLSGYDGAGRAVEIEVEEGGLWLASGENVAVRPTKLLSNYPNPFNPSTTVRFDLPRSGRVLVEVFDAAGRRIATLLDESRPAGIGEVMWFGVDRGGRPVASGVYYARLTAPALSATQRMILVK